jgi:hypothetical protein
MIFHSGIFREKISKRWFGANKGIMRILFLRMNILRRQMNPYFFITHQ